MPSLLYCTCVGDPPGVAAVVTKVSDVVPTTIGSGVVSLYILPALTLPSLIVVCSPNVTLLLESASRARRQVPFDPVPAVNTSYIPFWLAVF